MKVQGNRKSLKNMIKDFNKDAIYTIHTLGELDELDVRVF